MSRPAEGVRPRCVACRSDQDVATYTITIESAAWSTTTAVVDLCGTHTVLSLAEVMHMATVTR